MRTAIVVLCFASVVVALLQPPRADGASDNTKTRQATTGNQSPGSPNPIIAPSNTTTEAKPDSSNISGAGDKQPSNQSVSVVQMPALNVEPDLVDYWQLFLTVIILVLTIGQLVFSSQNATAATNAATAARDSADTASDALRLLNQPWLDTADWRVTTRLGPAIADNQGGYTQDFLGLTVLFNIVNNSSTPATLYRLDISTDTITGDISVSEQVDAFMPPGSKHPSHVDISLNERQRQQYFENGVLIDIQGIAHFGDMFRTKKPTGYVGPRQRHFGRRSFLRGHGSEFHPLPGAERIEPEESAAEEG